MLLQHQVVQGDCIDSIAADYGSTPDCIWNHSANAELRDLRKDPNVLLAGDVVNVPRDPKTVPAPTDALYRFKLSSATSRLRVTLVDWMGQPRKQLGYRLVCDGAETAGQTDDDGTLDLPIRGNLSEAQLFLADQAEPYDLRLGYVDPIDSVSGVQARLNNLGLEAGDEDGVVGEATQQALVAFQTAYDLDASGDVDDATRAGLMKLHGQ